MSKCFIVSHSGIRVDLLEPAQDMFLLEDICWGLSNICRFVGHCSRFYSVLEHSWLGSRYLDAVDAVEFLLHDAAEAYIGDISSPLKNRLYNAKEIETGIDRCIRCKFGLPLVCSNAVKEVDLRMLATEKRDLMPATQELWTCLKGVIPFRIRIPDEEVGDLMSKWLHQIETWVYNLGLGQVNHSKT